MAEVQFEDADRLRRWGDRIACLHVSRTRQIQVENHPVELALRALETRDLGRTLEASGHARGFRPHDVAEAIDF